MTKRNALMLGGATVSLLAATAIVAFAQNAPSDGPRIATAGAPSAPCETLAAAAFPDATVTLAEAREAGAFTPPGGGAGSGPRPAAAARTGVRRAARPAPGSRRTADLRLSGRSGLRRDGLGERPVQLQLPARRARRTAEP